MNIFSKRPLSLILCVVLSGFSVFSFSGYIFKAVLVGVASAALITVIFIKAIKNKKLTIIALSLMLASFVLSFVFFELIFYPSDKLVNKETDFTAKITYVEDNPNFTSLDLRLMTADGKFCRKKLKMTLYADSNGLKAGDLIEFSGTITSFNSDGSFDFAKYYTSKGFCAAIEANEISLLSSEKKPLLSVFKDIRNNISDRAVELTDETTGGMLAALLLGERDRLAPRISLDFARIGITHILSLSGLHLAILVAGLSLLLKLFRVGKRVRLVINCIFCLIFMALTGFPITV